ncbi:MAG: tetratricopeptide repeat protein [Verrucomicrobiales bacterium]|nr:tetratricopeptide repeat protein [Verrucomicrobiales bacterium]
MPVSRSILLFLLTTFLLVTTLPAQTPRVKYPNQKSEPNQPAKGNSGARSLGKMATFSKDPAAKKNEVKPEFPPGAINPGTLDPALADSLPEALQPFAKEGALAMAERDFAKAKKAFETMVKGAPDSALAHANLGMAEFQLKNYAAAREHLGISLQKNPNISQTWVNLGLVHFEEDQLELAISSITRGLALEPANARSHLLLGVVVREYGWPEAAETQFRKAVTLDPRNVDAHFNLALLYLEKQPAALELARRHYYLAVDLGAKPDPAVESKLKPASGP